MNGLIAYSESYGVYLGSFLGLGFWSKLDPVGQTSAVVFTNEKDYMECVSSWESPPPEDTKLIAVEHENQLWATMEECVEAGIPAWEV